MQARRFDLKSEFLRADSFGSSL